MENLYIFALIIGFFLYILNTRFKIKQERLYGDDEKWWLVKYEARSIVRGFYSLVLHIFLIVGVIGGIFNYGIYLTFNLGTIRTAAITIILFGATLEYAILRLLNLLIDVEKEED